MTCLFLIQFDTAADMIMRQSVTIYLYMVYFNFILTASSAHLVALRALQ